MTQIVAILRRWLFGEARESALPPPASTIPSSDEAAHTAHQDEELRATIARPQTPPPQQGIQPSTEGAELRDLVVGLDFGTSCTKVVIRSPFMYGARAVAIPNGALGRSSPQQLSHYLFPSRVYKG
jgi:hypothetical protein